MGIKKYKRVLIANRGEIALRIIRALKELNIESVAIYSDADQESRHRHAADYAVRLPGVTSADTYLNINAIMTAIKMSGAEAVHPGYGFLSENAKFAETLESEKIKLIGPSSKALGLMGDKIAAKKLMIENNIPVVPGSKQAALSYEDLKKDVQEIGYPVIIKAAAGGGGRGMRIVRQDSDLEDAYEACKREAQAYFANPEVFCERYIENPRHIEFQVLFDSKNNGVHLFERDCSIQRRHQKLIEEAPSEYLSDQQRQKLGEIAIKVARAVGYEGAGTVEFICDSPDEAFFMEMNTRIQVEHPVTEMITGKDLIKYQIRVAQGEPLDFDQSQVAIHGHAIEARINAEDVSAGFLPSPQKIKHLVLPDGPFVRVDSHIFQGYTIPAYYDSMIAKLIVWGENREEAMIRLKRALAEFQFGDLKTTVPFHEWLLEQDDFRKGTFTTKFLEQNEKKLSEHFTHEYSDADMTEIAVAGSLLIKNKQCQTFLNSGNIGSTKWRQQSIEETLG